MNEAVSAGRVLGCENWSGKSNEQTAGKDYRENDDKSDETGKCILNLYSSIADMPIANRVIVFFQGGYRLDHDPAKRNQRQDKARYRVANNKDQEIKNPHGATIRLAWQSIQRYGASPGDTSGIIALRRDPNYCACIPAAVRAGRQPAPDPDQTDRRHSFAPNAAECRRERLA